MHLVVGELDDHLHIRIGGALELLDQALPITLVCLHLKIVLTDDILKVFSRALDRVLDILIDDELDGKGFREVGADGRVGEVEFVGEDEHVGVIVEAMGGCAVHHAVFAHEAGGAVVVDDELEVLIEPTVTAVAVPVLMGALFECDWGGIVEADYERGRFDSLERSCVRGVGSDQGLARFGPDVTVLSREDPNSRRLFSLVVNPSELLLQFRSIQLLTVDLVHDLEELILADNNNVLMLIVIVFYRIIFWLSRYTASIEHPLVRLHADGQLPHILRFEGSGIYLVLELQDRTG